MGGRYFVDALHQAAYDLLTRHGVGDLAAIEEAGKFCDALQTRFGGREHYLPRPDKTLRNHAIRRDLSQGKKPAEVAKAHKVSPDTVRRVAAREDDTPSGFGSREWEI